jgi:hypothetical protein
MDPRRHRKVSKYLSKHLRHSPERSAVATAPRGFSSSKVRPLQCRGSSSTEVGRESGWFGASLPTASRSPDIYHPRRRILSP